jgi:hypothetical protein
MEIYIKQNKMEELELENKELKTPKTVKKNKDVFSQETFDFLQQVLIDFAIDMKHRPKLKEILAATKPEAKSNSI